MAVLRCAASTLCIESPRRTGKNMPFARPMTTVETKSRGTEWPRAASIAPAAKAAKLPCKSRRLPPRLAMNVAKRFAAVFAAMFRLMRRLVATALAPICRASRGMKPKVTAQTPNWQSALVKEGTRTSRLRKIARIDRALTVPRCAASLRGILMHTMMMAAAIERPAAVKNVRP